MSCDSAATTYNIDGSVITVPASPSDDDKEVCRATKILERLHKEFTEKYYTTAGSQSSSGTQETTKTLVDSAENNPSYYLRKQPKSNADTSNTNDNRFYLNSINSEGPYKGDVFYRKMTSAIMKGVTDVTESTYNTAPNSITGLTNFNSPNEFKGIYGLNRVNEILETKINTLLSTLTPSSSSSTSPSASSGDAITRFGKRKDIKNTLEEVAYRENQIYREKFLNIILIVVGIFVVGTQLVQKYFGGGGGGGGGGSGSAGLGGLFGFGFGGSGGLFSRFGGLGLGSSGRSRIGNLFTNSSYALKQR
jgi:hypothetical protein